MTNDIVDYNKRLLQMMEHRRISQADLCRLTGLASSMVSHYCTGQRMPSMAAALKIAQALNTTVRYLAYGDRRKGTHPDGAYTVAEKDTPYNKNAELVEGIDDEQELLEKILLLSREGQAKVIDYIEDLLATGNYN